MLATVSISFDRVDCIDLDNMSDEGLDQLSFGVIGIDGKTSVVAYNSFESAAAGLNRDRVIGRHLFDVVAPCMNNYMVAHRFEDASDRRVGLDFTLPYVLTLKMKPTKVHLRLLAQPEGIRRYVLVQRHG